MANLRIISFLFLALNGQIVPAQPMRFDHLSLEQGVSHNLVYSIHQDRDGFMWFGTMYSLVKYDGRQYTTYRHDPRDEHSLSFNDVIAIHEDRQGNLWIGTWGGGLNKFDRSSETFTRYLHDPNDSTSLVHDVVWAIQACQDGSIWVGTEGGLDMLVAGSNHQAKFIHYQISPPNPIYEKPIGIRDLCEDRAGRLWIGTYGGGLNLLKGERFVSFLHDPANPSSLSSNLVNSIYEDRDNNLWIGTMDGLNKLARESLKSWPDPAVSFVHYQNDSLHRHSLSHNAIGPIVEDQDGSLWIGTLGGGLNKFDRATGHSARYQHDPANSRSLISSNHVVALCADQAGALWIGSYQGGVDKYDPSQYKFAHFQNRPDKPNSLSHNSVRALFQDQAGVLWIGTMGGGLNRAVAPKDAFLDEASPIIRYPKTLSSDLITAVHEDKPGVLWIGTADDGLYALDRQRQQLTHYQNRLDDSTSLSRNVISAIYEDHSGTLWIGTIGGGLNQFERENKRFIRYERDEANPQSLSDNTIHAIYEDRRGALWLGTYRGLNKFSRQTQTFTRYQHRRDDPASLSNDYVYAIYEDTKENLWVGTSDGLNRFDRESEKFTGYKESEGLPNGVICGILEDENAKLWIATKKGLAQFDPSTMAFRCFDVADGLQSNMFNIGAFHKNRAGELFFGGINGFNRLHPAHLKTNPHVPPVRLTAFRVFGQPRPIPPTPEINLSYKENFISFDFAALSYATPAKNRYAYRLEGLDRAWIYSGAQATANYTDLKPGRYLFRAKGANQDGVWNEKGAGVQIIIAPPFWRTWWFYALSGVSLGLLAMLLLHMRIQRERRRVAEIERLKSAERLVRFKAIEQAKSEERERVRKQIAADFHDESGNKLTKISLFCGVLQSKMKNGTWDIEEYVERIMKVAASLQKDMSDFIWALDPQENTLHDAALKLKDFGEKLFDRTGIRFRVQGLTPELEMVHLTMEARQNLTCIFKEAMNNVLKHTRERCKNVTCAFACENGGYAVTLLDDGQGFDPPRCAPGHGLRNMQNRAAVIHGNLEVVSRPREGTIIKFSGKPSLVESIVEPALHRGQTNGNSQR